MRTMIMRMEAALVAVVVGVFLPAVARSQATESARTADPAAAKADSSGPPVNFRVSLAGVYETNIDRDSDNPLASRGIVVGAGADYRTSADDPVLRASYEAAFHEYSGTDRWDRISHYLFAALQPRIDGPVVLETIGEASVKGSSEDRDLSDQVGITQRLGYEIADGVEAVGYGGYRYKWAEDPERSATNPFGGLELTVGIGDAEITGDVRYEQKNTRNERYSYDRWRYELEMEYELGDLGELEVEGIYRDQQYPNRMVQMEDGEGDEIEVARHDKRAEVGLTWIFPLIDRALDLGVDYRFETRDSNDKGNDYNAHTLSAVLTYTF